ncbi:hypothetical protein [Salinirussus salinus]|uniref:hypothetical protein n=1 Tax=Salinirussus salinus TaxID=1198300 RepID=UPI00191598D3|nr:hypothetical protein [Salinirussus salinus]
MIDGQKRVFQHPKQAELTKKGEQHLEQADTEPLDEYENLSHRELVEKTHRLENQLEDLKQKFEVFREQVQRSIE